MLIKRLSINNSQSVVLLTNYRLNSVESSRQMTLCVKSEIELMFYRDAH